jgi:hypothetical protein
MGAAVLKNSIAYLLHYTLITHGSVVDAEAHLTSGIRITYTYFPYGYVIRFEGAESL